jgi:hypothetical protein
MPALARRSNGLFYLDGELARMIHVHAHPERMIFRQHCTQLGVIRCGRKIGTRVPMRRNSMCLIVRNRDKQLLEPVIAENQSVATTQKHVAYFGVFFEITERLLEIGVQFLFANSANHSTPGAIAAVTRTTIRHQE